MSLSAALGRASAGLLAGLVGGIAMTLMMLVLRTLFGISPPMEMIPDRFAPTLTIDQFFGLIGRFGGYNELKQFGATSVLLGQITVATLLGAVYGIIARPARTTSSTSTSSIWGSTATRLLIGVVVALWVASLVILWPTLPTSFIGLPPTIAAPVSAIGLLTAYATFGLVLAFAFRVLVARGAGASLQPGPVTPPGAPSW